MSDLVNLLDVIVETTGATLPEGCDSWGIKSTAPDLITTHNFQWPFPGGTCRSDDHIDPDNDGACPSRGGDGLCIATDWQGMASGGHPAHTLILVAYASGNVLGRDDSAGKLRVMGDVHVVALADGERLIRMSGKHANLRRANLTGADLTRADLSGADLSGADLYWANLYGANLTGANLTGANLTGADLRGANLTGANLTGADLTGANLSGANLTGADLTRADLYGANLTGADLTRADLYGANLTLPNVWTLTDTGIAVRS